MQAHALRQLCSRSRRQRVLQVWGNTHAQGDIALGDDDDLSDDQASGLAATRYAMCVLASGRRPRWCGCRCCQPGCRRRSAVGRAPSRNGTTLSEASRYSHTRRPPGWLEGSSCASVSNRCTPRYTTSLHAASRHSPSLTAACRCVRR
jgi:hypothetical protein